MPNPVESPDIAKLEQDVKDVFVSGIKKLTDFPVDYQPKMVTFYRFSALKFDSNEEVNVPRTYDTLDII